MTSWLAHSIGFCMKTSGPLPNAIGYGIVNTLNYRKWYFYCVTRQPVYVFFSWYPDFWTMLCEQKVVIYRWIYSGRQRLARILESNNMYRRKIRLIEGNAKCRHLKKLTWKGLCGRFLCVWGPEPYTPRYTLYTCIQYTYSHREGGRGRRVKPERRGERQQFIKLGRKYQHDWLYLWSTKLW
jgi:hypothetical protein